MVVPVFVGLLADPPQPTAVKAQPRPKASRTTKPISRQRRLGRHPTKSRAAKEMPAGSNPLREPPCPPVRVCCGSIPATWDEEPEPVVETVSVAVSAESAVTCPEAGLIEHVGGLLMLTDTCEVTAQVRLTVPEKPCADEMVIASVAKPPGELMVRLVVDGARATDVPIPASATVWGDPPALSVMVRVPLRAPDVVGVKTTEIAQVVPAATDEPQVLVWL